MTNLVDKFEISR